MLDGQPALDDNNNTILCAILLAKLSASTHSNVVNSGNEDNAQELWKSIMKRFISSEPSNRACVYIGFANITFDVSNIEKFVTEVQSSLTKMEDTGISLPEDVLTYELLRRLPSSLDGIKQNITHSKNGEDIRPEVLLDHLKIHMNELKVSASTQAESIGTTMLTSKDKKCRAD
jgi:CRISPR/Cas system-associated protein Cas10 (large subunit of type III CRISPR-Cas system)